MKYLFSLLLLSALGAGLLRTPANAALGAPKGRYLDVRTATVFGGACHIGSERQSQGRNGLMAWSVESGSHAGVSLAGVRLVAAVTAGENLVNSGAATSRLVIDAPTAATAEAAQAWVEAVAGESLGLLEHVYRGPVRLELGGESFLLDVPEFAQAQGSSLPDHACCSMPDQRWYEPLVGSDKVPTSLVGFSESARFEGLGELPAWRYDGANNALFGQFGSVTESVRAANAEAVDS